LEDLKKKVFPGGFLAFTRGPKDP